MSETVPAQLATVASAEECKKRLALESSGERLTYGQLDERIARAGGLLRNAGVRSGDTVAIMCDTSTNLVATIFGAMRIGAVACPLELRLNEADLLDRLREANSKALVVDANHRRLTSALRDLSDLTLIDADDILDAPPAAIANLSSEDEALILFSTGSTSRPKVIRLTHANLLSNARGVTLRTRVSSTDRLLHVMPLYHTNGINNQLLVPLLAGASVILKRRFIAEEFFTWVERHRPTYFTGVPTIYYRLLAQKPPKKGLDSVRFARCGSAPLSRQLHCDIESHLSVPLVLSYGCTEATCTSTMNPPDARRIGTVGTALPGQQVFLLEPEGIRPSRAESSGEICVAGGTVVKDLAEEDREDIRGPWLRTGDVGTFDPDGYLTVTDRVKDIIIRGGENISPGTIEAVLLEHSAVSAAAVVGIADAEYGEVPVAFVIPKGFMPRFENSVRSYAAEHLSPSQLPTCVVSVDEFPTIGVGKIDSSMLKRWGKEARGG